MMVVFEKHPDKVNEQLHIGDFPAISGVMADHCCH